MNSRIFSPVGCKIKALRAKTNTYIKTPVRGEEPVFVVTGRREDVAMARREIISAAEHFSMIRASRNKNNGVNGSASVPGPPNLPGQTSIQVRVPYRVVGLVVGPKGATIKRIQQQTHTYIVTPSRDKEPVFEVTGMPENVDRARDEIEAHIAMRTGAGIIEFAATAAADDNDFHANGTDVGFEMHAGTAGHHASLWSKTSTSASATPSLARKPFASYRNDSSSSLGSASTDSYFGTNYSPPSPALSYNNNNNNNNLNASFVYGEMPSPDGTELGFDPAPGLLWSQYERGLSAAAPIFPSSASSNANFANQRSVPPRLTPPLQEGGGATDHPLARRVRSDPGGGSLSFPGYGSISVHLQGLASDSSGSSASSSSSSSSSSSRASRKGSRDCSVCFESEVIAALVPCGHNLFCMECANRICQRSEPECPVCRVAVTQAIRIFS